MGQKAREVVEKAGLNVEELIGLLNKAYCDEWLAYHQYWLGAKLVEGIPRSALQPEMEEHAGDELKHAGMLAERIIQLGGTPVLDPMKWVETSNCRYDAPVNAALPAILKQNISGERCAIGVYYKLMDYVKGKDIVTGHILREILDDEIDHEQDLEDIARDIESFGQGCTGKPGK